MTFINEYFTEADNEKYDIKRICMEHNLTNRDHMYSRSWTIDREIDVFLIQIWAHHESEFSGYSLYWKGNWVFFDMKILDFHTHDTDETCSISYEVRNFNLASNLVKERDEIISDLIDALSCFCGAGVFSTVMNCKAAVKFTVEDSL